MMNTPIRPSEKAQFGSPSEATTRIEIMREKIKRPQPPKKTAFDDVELGVNR